MTTRYSAQEEAGWGELNEMLQEVYEIHEMEGETSGPADTPKRGGAKRYRIQTPVVIIRISLAPSRMPVFASPRVITDAQTPRPVVTPVSAKPYVPIQAPEGTNSNGAQPRGVVFMPQRNTNQVYVATNSPTYAGSWIRRQAQVQPTFGRRIRKVQVLVDGKPCNSCINQLVKSASPAMPQGTRMIVRHVQKPGTILNAVPYQTVNRPANSGLIHPTGFLPPRRATGLRPVMTTGQTQSVPTRRPTAPVTQVRRPIPQSMGPTTVPTRRPTAPVTQIRRPMSPATGPTTLAPRRSNGQFAPRHQTPTGMKPVAPQQQRPVQQPLTGRKPVAPQQQRPAQPPLTGMRPIAPTQQRPALPLQGLARKPATAPQRETQSFLGALFGESGL